MSADETAGESRGGVRLDGAGESRDGVRLDGAGESRDGVRLDGAGESRDGVPLHGPGESTGGVPLDGPGESRGGVPLDGADTKAATRILLVDDHALFREGLVRLLEADSTLEVVGHCATIEAALAIVDKSAPNLVLLDYDLGGQKAPAMLRRLHDQGYSGKVLILTAGASDYEARELLALGAAGIFLKHDPPEILGRCVEKVMAGEIWLNQHHLRALIQAPPLQQEARLRKLTEREREVLRSLLEGLANKEIGVRLGVSESTVKSAMQQLFQKIGVRTRSQLVRVTLEQYMDQL